MFEKINVLQSVSSNCLFRILRNSYFISHKNDQGVSFFKRIQNGFQQSYFTGNFLLFLGLRNSQVKSYFFGDWPNEAQPRRIKNYMEFFSS